MKQCILILSFLLAGIMSGWCLRPELHWLEGTWEGTGENLSAHYPWTIQLIYHADDAYIRLEYPSHHCGGALKIITLEAGKASCVEDVNYGLDQCISGLKVSIVQEQDGSITVTYYNLGENSIRAVAKLVRKSL